MKFEDFLTARKHAGERRTELANGYENDDREHPVANPELVKYIFDLQGTVEKEGPMDYRIYASRMWQKLAGDATSEGGEGFRRFREQLIGGLHDIDMRDHMYPKVKQAMPKLIEQYGSDLEKVALWSTGDVEATGYQVEKIERSGITLGFISELKKSMEKSGVRKFVREKTTYMVDDNKFDRLSDYVAAQLPNYQESGEKMKIVIVEDSVKNFEKVRSALQQRFGSETDAMVDIISIWAAYSREGKAAARKADQDGTQQQFKEQKQKLNALDSFDQLLDMERFGDILKRAHLFVDFDGVIGNNITMREEQAKVIYRALINGMEKEFDITEDEARKRIAEKL